VIALMSFTHDVRVDVKPSLPRVLPFTVSSTATPTQNTRLARGCALQWSRRLGRTNYDQPVRDDGRRCADHHDNGQRFRQQPEPDAFFGRLDFAAKRLACFVGSGWQMEPRASLGG
jgi:hypothetical protein